MERVLKIVVEQSLGVLSMLLRSLVISVPFSGVFTFVLLRARLPVETLPLFVSGIAFFSGGILAEYAFRTRHRSRDPYRFSNRQFRFFLLPHGSRIPASMEKKLETLEYDLQSRKDKSDGFEIEFLRSEFSDKKRFNPKKIHQWRTLIVRFVKLNEGGLLLIECLSAGHNYIGDISLTTYGCLEEINEELALEDFELRYFELSDRMRTIVDSKN